MISKSFRDFSLTFEKNAVTNDVLALKNEAAIKESVKNIVLYNFYEKPFDPFFGGNIIGLSTFTLLSGGETVFIKSFNPAGINTSNNQEIDINDHEFNTGERLIYSGVGNTSIGIVTTSVPGIGNTNILPPDVFPIKDLGIKKGMKVLFKLDKLPDDNLMIKNSNRWKPYRTIACLYLWKIIDGNNIEW